MSLIEPSQRDPLPKFAMLSLPSKQGHEELAIDEALLEGAEAGEGGEIARIWELQSPVVVVGRGSRLGEEVSLERCQEDRVPVLRRCSGGAAIVAGPGCLLYSLVLSMDLRPDLRKLDRVHHFVMHQLLAALAPHLDQLRMEGTCDLTWKGRKFSGNSLRLTRNWILYHGTILYASDLELVGRYLRMPPRRPAYRADREHEHFVTNIPLSRTLLVDALQQQWSEGSLLDTYPHPRAERLLAERYENPHWHARH